MGTVYSRPRRRCVCECRHRPSQEPYKVLWIPLTYRVPTTAHVPRSAPRPSVPRTIVGTSGVTSRPKAVPAGPRKPSGPGPGKGSSGPEAGRETGVAALGGKQEVSGRARSGPPASGERLGRPWAREGPRPAGAHWVARRRRAFYRRPGPWRGRRGGPQRAPAELPLHSVTGAWAGRVRARAAPGLSGAVQGRAAAVGTGPPARAPSGVGGRGS